MSSPIRNNLRRAAIGFALISTVFAAVSCDLSDIVGNGDLSPEDQAGTVQALIEEQLATLQAPSTTPEPTATTQAPDCSGATFNLDASVAAGTTVEFLPQDEGEPGIPFTIHPAMVQYTFQGYVLADTFHDPIIRIYPVDDYVALMPSIADTVALLQQMLIDQPAQPAGGIPFLPIWNAAQMVRAKVSYLSFQNGSGVRFITQYGQAYWLVNSHDAFYTFQGLTNGGECYISAIFPASNPALPAEGAPPPGETEPEIIAYYDAIVPQLNAMSDASFVPSFTVLDALIASLEIQ